MTSFLELLEKKNNTNKNDGSFFFIGDSELNEIEELLTILEDGTKVYDPIKVTSSAIQYGYWCEADYIENEGGYIFEKL